MTQNLLIAASTSWPDAAIAIAGVVLVGSVAVVVVWQALATWRTRMTAGVGDRHYRELSQRLERLDERVLDLAARLEERPK
jgi:hypothetical protein